MMRQALRSAPRAQVCQLCELHCSSYAPSAKRTLVSLSASKLRPERKQLSTQSIRIRQLARAITTSRPRPAAQQAQQAVNSSGIETRFSQSKDQQITDPASLAALVDRVTKAFLAQQGIPSEKTTYDALRACGQINVDALPESEPSSESRSDAEGHSETTHLLDLDGQKKKTTTKATARMAPKRPLLSKQELADKISSAAYAIIKHPTVILTPRLLDEYVRLQARLGKPQTLTEIFSLYRVKPLPQNAGGSIRFVERNPDKVQNAVPAKVADRALDAAIEAKNLDAAVGIVANTFAAKPFLRSKLLNKGVIPGLAVSILPVGAYILASSMSLMQDSMDTSAATGVAFAAILAYLGFTGTIGVVMVTTANDQMKRVTWLPGMPLRQRWLREEERAALDKVACAFGFREQHRYGEEDGPEFAALRSYILGRGMILDAVELMEGMS